MTMVRRVEDWSRPLVAWRAWRQPLVVLNICVIAAGMVLAALAYRGIEGQGDDLSNLNPAAHPTEWHYLKMLYTEWGQVGFGVLMVPLRLFVRLFGAGPDAFPWWCFAGVNAALNILSVVHFVLAGRALVGYSRSWTIALTAFLSGVWLINLVSFSTTLGIPVVFFAAYTLPLYLLSLVALGFATAAVSATHSRMKVLAALYLLISLNEATFMLSLPVLISAFTVVKARRAARPVEAFARMIVIWAAAVQRPDLRVDHARVSSPRAAPRVCGAVGHDALGQNSGVVHGIRANTVPRTGGRSWRGPCSCTRCCSRSFAPASSFTLYRRHGGA